MAGRVTARKKYRSRPGDATVWLNSAVDTVAQPGRICSISAVLPAVPHVQSECHGRSGPAMACLTQRRHPPRRSSRSRDHEPCGLRSCELHT
eukprot:scaffold11693_cov115-Isochrysis_galbana.AAC.4